MLLAGLRKSVRDAAVHMVQSGLSRGTSGNLSALDPETNLVAITPSGVPYSRLTPQDIVVVNLEGDLVEGKYQPSSETPMHTSIYRIRKEVLAVVHTHSLYATGFAVVGRELPELTVPMALYGSVPVVPFCLPGSCKLADEVVASLGQDGNAVLLQNHGVLCIGSCVEKTLEHALYIEEAAQVGFISSLIGQPVTIPKQYAEALRQKRSGSMEAEHN